MEIIKRQMPPDYEIVDTGDWHIGPLNCNFEGIEKTIDYVKNNKNVFLVLKGDLIDAISPKDKRYAHCVMENPKLKTAQQQANKVLEILRPVKDKILFVMIGNHEFKQINEVDWGQYWADALGVPYGGYIAKFIHLDENNEPRLKMLFVHGYGSVTSQAKDTIQRIANIKAGIKRKLEATGHADCIYMSMGHMHKLIAINPTVSEEIMLTDNGEDIKQEYRVFQNQSAKYIPPEARWFGCSGSFLNLYTPPGHFAVSYGEMAMYSPPEHGYLKPIIRNNEMVALEKVVI